MKIFFLITSVLFALSSHAKDCSYSFDYEKSEVKGTGYKYTKKTAVDALFSGFKLNKNVGQKNKKDLLKGLVVTVDLMTVDSGNSLRDKNMRETLFANILGDSVVTITVKKVTAKKIKTEVKLNEKTQLVDFDYVIKENMISAQGVFDFVEYALGEQIAALKKRCGSLHTGSDDKSVTWTDFNLSVKAKLNKKCS